MEQITHIIEHIKKVSQRMWNSFHDLGRDSSFDWFIVCFLTCILVIVGGIIGLIQYRSIVTAVTGFIPTESKAVTRDFDITKAQKSLEAFTQKALVRQEVIRGARDIKEFTPSSKAE